MLPASCYPLCSSTKLARVGTILPSRFGPLLRISVSWIRLTQAFDPYASGVLSREHHDRSAAKAVGLVTAGRVEALMKGSLHTDELMSAVVAHEGGIRTERRISHCFIMDVPGHADPLIVTDAAVNILPDLEAKVDIIQNAIDRDSSAAIIGGTPPHFPRYPPRERGTTAAEMPEIAEAQALLAALRTPGRSHAGSGRRYGYPLQSFLRAQLATAKPRLRRLHLVVRETEFCGLRLAGEFRRGPRENGRNSVRRPRFASLTRNYGGYCRPGNRVGLPGLHGGGRSPAEPVCGGRIFRIMPTFASSTMR